MGSNSFSPIYSRVPKRIIWLIIIKIISSRLFSPIYSRLPKRSIWLIIIKIISSRLFSPIYSRLPKRSIWLIIIKIISSHLFSPIYSRLPKRSIWLIIIKIISSHLFWLNIPPSKLPNYSDWPKFKVLCFNPRLVALKLALVVPEITPESPNPWLLVKSGSGHS
jgi:hypothetical protein